MSLALFAAGQGLQLWGQVRANRDQARAERQNAAWMREQAAFIKKASLREESIFKTQMEQVISEQQASFAAKGIEMSGSVLDIIDSTFEQGREEIQAIRDQADMQIRGSLLRAGAAEEHAGQLSSFRNNAMQFGGSFLTGSAQYFGQG